MSVTAPVASSSWVDVMGTELETVPSDAPVGEGVGGTPERWSRALFRSSRSLAFSAASSGDTWSPGSVAVELSSRYWGEYVKSSGSSSSSPSGAISVSYRST